MNRASFEPDFSVAVQRGEHGPVIEVTGELDSGTCDELTSVFETLSSTPRDGAITLDLSRVSFIDSAGTRSVIMIERAAQAAGISLLVAAPPGEVTELLRTAGIIERFQLAPDSHRATLDASRMLERAEFELPREPQSPARARAEVRGLLTGRDQTQVADVVLLTSEIVTNAVVHPAHPATGAIGLRVFTYADGIRLEVEDTGDGFDPTVPSNPAPERGRGLFLVDRFASRWGTEHVDGEDGRRFMVWFELDWDEHRSPRTARQ